MAEWTVNLGGNRRRAARQQQIQGPRRQVTGAVVDVQFETATLPEILNALETVQ